MLENKISYPITCTRAYATSGIVDREFVSSQHMTCAIARPPLIYATVLALQLCAK